MKAEIIKYLGDRYEPTDETLIDELIFNIKILGLCKIEILDTDFQLVITTESREEHVVTKLNPLLAAYDGRLKNIKDLCTKLGISPQDREKLKLIKPKESDFEKNFN